MALPVGELLLELWTRPLLCDGVDERRPVGVNSARPCVTSPVTFNVSRSSMFVRPLAARRACVCVGAGVCECAGATNDVKGTQKTSRHVSNTRRH